MAAKFVQIAVGATESGDSIYALDAKGGVWFYASDDERWEKLSSDRVDDGGEAEEEETE